MSAAAESGESASFGPTAGHRLITTAAVGLVTAAALGIGGAPWEYMVLGGWLGAALLFLVRIWARISGLSPAATARLAQREDDSRATAGLLLVTAALASLIGSAFGLLRASHHTGADEVATTVLSVGVVIVSWAVVHTVFALRYAHEYYGREPGGIDFSGNQPDYIDFAYLAFTVGMTFQVSDTQITSRTIRRTLLRHALLSYVFGTVIVAVTINVVAGFLQK